MFNPFKLLVNVFRRIDPAHLEQALALVSMAGGKFLSEPERRAWVVAELQKLPGVSESTARLLLEIGLAHLKASNPPAAADAPVAAPGA